jgi:hypothetical protein
MGRSGTVPEQSRNHSDLEGWNRESAPVQVCRHFYRQIVLAALMIPIRAARSRMKFLGRGPPGTLI